MPANEEQQRDKYFAEFGQHAARRHEQLYAARARGELAAVESASLRLGRYLRAARRNAAFTVAQVAERANLPAATVQALEQGLIPADDIKPRWLKQLAATLNEDAADLQLLLGRPLRAPRRHWPGLNGRPLVNPGPLSRSIYATLSAMALCAMIGLALIGQSRWPMAGMLTVVSPEQPAGDSGGSPVTLVHVNADRRLNLIKAEKQKMLPPPVEIIAPSEPLRMIPDFYNRVEYLTLFDETGAPHPLLFNHSFNWFDNPVLVLWALTSFTPDGRFNIAKAEYRVEDQIRVQPKIIPINSENRLNMVKAEIRL